MSDPDSGSGVLVLLSGGIDSTACVDFYLRRGGKVRALFVDYGQAGASQETEASSKVAAHYGVGLRQVRCAGLETKSAGLIQGRNAFLVLLGLMEFGADCGLITLGIHAGTDYWDCSPTFVHHMGDLLDAYTGGRIRLAAPFLEWSKAEVWEYCRMQNVPVSLTYSCEQGLDQPCGRCLSCRDLENLYAGTPAKH